MSPFADRHDAGRFLARSLARYAAHPDGIVLGLPRGGVVVGYEVAQVLDLPLDVYTVRKMGVPGIPELAMGAVASGGEVVLNHSVILQYEIDEDTLKEAIAAGSQEVSRLDRQFRNGRPPVELRDRVVILVDDGLATGATMRAAAMAVRKQEPARVVIAVPVGSAEGCREFQLLVDEVVCAHTPRPFVGVGMWYEDFSQTMDGEVRELLNVSIGRAVGHGGQS